MKILEHLVETETHESQPTSPLRLDAPLFIYPRLATRYANLMAIAGILALFALYAAFYRFDNIALFLGLSALTTINPAITSMAQVLGSRLCLTNSHLDLSLTFKAREIVRWSEILDIREVTLPRRWFYLWETGAYIVKTPRGTYHLSKSMWPDGEWLILYYRNQTGREIRQVNYW